MAIEVLDNALILAGPWNISGDSNSVKVDVKQDLHDTTRFGHTEHRFTPGILEFDFDGQGFVDFDDSTAINPGVDKKLFDSVAASARALTVAQDTADGSYAYLASSAPEDYNFNLNVATPGAFNFKAKCAGDVARGRILVPLASRVATLSPSTIYQLGALTASQKLTANLHVTAFDGTSLILTILSNDTNNVTTPTTRLTFATATGTTSESKTVAGAITDTYWYAVLTFVGTSFSAAVSAGIR